MASRCLKATPSCHFNSPILQVPFVRSRLHLQLTFPSLSVSFRDTRCGKRRGGYLDEAKPGTLIGCFQAGRHCTLPNPNLGKKKRRKRKRTYINTYDQPLFLRLVMFSPSRFITRFYFILFFYSVAFPLVLSPRTAQSVALHHNWTGSKFSRSPYRFAFESTKSRLSRNRPPEPTYFGQAASSHRYN